MGVTIAIISVFVTILFGIPSYISVYYAKKDHDKKNQASVTQEGKSGIFDERFNRAIDQLRSEKMEFHQVTLSLSDNHYHPNQFLHLDNNRIKDHM